MNLAKRFRDLLTPASPNKETWTLPPLSSQETSHQQQNVVIPFPTPSLKREADTLESLPNESLQLPSNKLKAQVLFHLPELRDFLDQDQHAIGRKQGVQLGNASAHTQGQETMMADFKLRVQRVIELKQAKLDMLEHMGLQTRGLELGVAEEIETARDHLRRDINRLKEQIDAACHGKGWIEGPLKQYSSGFNEGVRIRMNYYITQ